MHALAQGQMSSQALREVLGGLGGPRRDVVLLNAAAGLYLAGKADSIEAGLAPAAQSIDRGAAADALETLVRVSHDQ